MRFGMSFVGSSGMSETGIKLVAVDMSDSVGEPSVTKMRGRLGTNRERGKERSHKDDTDGESHCWFGFSSNDWVSMCRGGGLIGTVTKNVSRRIDVRPLRLVR